MESGEKKGRMIFLNKRTLLVSILFLFLAPFVFSLSFILLSGYLFDSVIFMVIGFIINVGYVFIYIKSLNKRVKFVYHAIIQLIVIIISIYIVMCVPNGYLEP